MADPTDRDDVRARRFGGFEAVTTDGGETRNRRRPAPLATDVAAAPY